MGTIDAGSTADVRPWRVAESSPDSGPTSGQLRYEKVIDTLFIYFQDPERPTVGLVVDDIYTLLIDPETDELIAIEVGHFLSEAIVLHPALLPFLDVIDAPKRVVERVRRQVQPEQREEALEDVTEQLRKRYGGFGAHGMAHA